MSTQQSKQVGEKRNAPEGTSTPPTKRPKVAEVSKPETITLSSTSGSKTVVEYFTKYFNNLISKEMTNEEAKDWEDALQKLKRINGSILFSQSGPDLLNMLTGDPPQNYGIPTTPARAIAELVNELKDIEGTFCLQNNVFSVTPLRTTDLFLLHKFDQSYRPPYIGIEDLMKRVKETLATGRTKRTGTHPGGQAKTVISLVDGDDKAVIIATSGAKGRGKSRTLLEIANSLTVDGKYVIYVTYNSFTAQLFRAKSDEESIADFVVKDLTARIAYSFYRQCLALDSPLSFQQFVSKFIHWDFEKVVTDIAEFVFESFGITDIVFLLDELLT